MSEDLKVNKGIKITPEEAAKLDRAKMIVATSAPPEEREVEGQWWHRHIVHCPWCGHLEWALVNEHHRHMHWFSCGWCGGAFRAWA
jgi:hypothetical protein